MTFWEISTGVLEMIAAAVSEEKPPHPDSARERAQSDLSPHAGRGV